MWLWQHKNLHKRHLLWAKLFGICLFFHLIFLLWAFVIYHDNAYIISLSLHKKVDLCSPIIFVPQGISIKPIAAISTPIVQKNKTNIKPIKSANTKAATTKNISTTTLTTKNSAVAPQIIEKKIEAEPLVKQTSINNEKKIETPTKKAVDTTPPKIEPVKTLIPENAQVCHDYRQAEALRRGALLQKELVKQWHIPPGIPTNCTCEISFFVTKKGALQNLSVIKNSGIMMYDISARQALHSMTMPTWTYGKQIIINFAQ